MERERYYDWLSAVELYEKALAIAPKTDFLKRFHVQERIGYSLYRAGMQAENVVQFTERMRLAVANYEKAREFTEGLNELEKKPRMLRCDAMIAYLGFWLAVGVSEKKKLLEECWRLTKESLKAFKDAGDNLEYGKTYNELSQSACHRYELEWNFQAREKTIKEALDYGQEAVALLSTVGDSRELSRAHASIAAYLTTFSWYFIPDPDERAKYHQKALSYWQKAQGLSEDTALLEILKTFDPFGVWGWGTDEALTNCEKALEYSRKTRDKYLLGCAFDSLAYTLVWRTETVEDPDERAKLAQKALQYAEDAKQEFSSISFISPRGGTFWTEAPHAEYYYESAGLQTSLRKRRDLLEKAVGAGTDGLQRAESSGYPGIISIAHHVFSKILVSLAQTEINPDEKMRLLEKALEHRNESIKITEQLEPFSYWSRGVMQNYLADIKAELSDLEKGLENKRNLLEEAILNKEICLKLCLKHVSLFEKEGSLSEYAWLGRLQYSFGELLNQLYKLTNNREHLRKAIKAFEDAAESLQKFNLVSRIAECYWKVAAAHDSLGDHLKAAETFDSALRNYEAASEKIPQLSDFYQNHALYMQAWSEIEKARHHHGREEYGSAKEHYKKAAGLHKSLKQWSYLTANYSAWSQVEYAEDLSRKEKSEEAIRAFEEAAKLFSETKKSIQAELGRIEDKDEKRMATSLVKAAGLRREYCIGRIALEEAKVLDKKGDHYSSSQKYGSAAETFEKITQALELEQDRREIKIITTLSRAWQKMTLAETEASPALYMEASGLFEEAKELNTNERAKMLALGHSRFCRALEAGTKFSDTMDVTLHATAIQHLESAANYYMRAGLQNASEYAKATELLFDAYVYMDNAKRETDPEKKAKLYTMAEKVLQTSAGSFMKAEHPEKREQVLKLLERVKEERELAVSLSEVLHAPPIVSTTTVFAPPTPTHENAVGLERFEHADIQANVIVRQKELKVGEKLDLEVELVNAGRGPAQLVKLAEVFPEGFELMGKPEMYRVENRHVNMRGKRLDPLKTEEVRLALKPKVQGVFTLKPRILYLDENGRYKAHETEPITVTVKELGIKGWLKGPEKTSTVK